MARNEDCEGIKFIWKIENFSRLRGESLRSPCFGNVEVSMWGGIISYHNNNISFVLLPMLYAECVCNCSVALLDADGIPLIWRERKKVSSNDFVYFSEFISTYLLYTTKTIILNDTLTVQCCIWWTPAGLVTPVLLSALTRMGPRIIGNEVIIREFTWDITDVGSLQPLQVVGRKGAMSIGDSPILMARLCLKIKLKLSLNDDEEFEVTLTVISCKVITNMEIRITVSDTSGKNIKFANRDCVLMTKGQKWTFNTNVSKSMLMCHQSQLLPNDKLSLAFSCTFSKYVPSVTFNNMVGESNILANITRTTVTTISKISEAAVCGDDKLESNQPHPPKTVFQTLQDMYSEGFLSDFNLKVGDRVFPVHRCFLGARSQVFRAMFTTEMKEKQDNCVDIQDVDVDTLRRLLQFVYSDRLEENMGWEDASSLYAAADKYALEPLKQKCSAMLKSRMCVSNVFDVLSMADMHQDQDLKSAALDFVSLNDKAIVGSELWSKFEEKNAQLALETCRELYLKKIKD